MEEKISINGNVKREEEDIYNNGFNKDEEEPLCPWVKRVELPTFEGNDPKGLIARAENVFEVRNIRGSAKLRPTFIRMEGNGGHWFKFWRQKSNNPGKILQQHY